MKHCEKMPITSSQSQRWHLQMSCCVWPKDQNPNIFKLHLTEKSSKTLLYEKTEPEVVACFQDYWKDCKNGSKLFLCQSIIHINNCSSCTWSWVTSCLFFPPCFPAIGKLVKESFSPATLRSDWSACQWFLHDNKVLKHNDSGVFLSLSLSLDRSLKDSWHPEMSHNKRWAQAVSTLTHSVALRGPTSSLLHQAQSSQ